jgi:hypothetical protein
MAYSQAQVDHIFEQTASLIKRQALDVA